MGGERLLVSTPTAKLTVRYCLHRLIFQFYTMTRRSVSTQLFRRALLARCRRRSMLACLLALSSATSSMPSRITTIAPGNFARVLPSRVQAAFALEAASYPADEAATLENLQLRAEVAGEYFWGVSEGGALEGFICGTLTCGDTLTEESMSAHDPAGKTLCIHSVVVAEERRRLGLGSAMLKARHMCSMRTAMLHAAHCM